MIGYLSGEVISINDQSIILLCGQIGYEVFCSGKIIKELELNTKLELFIYTKVREDDISLFGFTSRENLSFFKLLISVNGVGAKTGLEIMNSDINQVKNAITQGNTVFLSKTPGIGKKTAERIIVDLKNSVIPDSFQEINNKLDQKLEDTIAALTKLGYQRGEIHRILKNLPDQISSTEEMVTYFLQNV